MNKWNLSMFILITCLVTMFAMIGCGGGGGSVDPIPVLPTSTPTNPNQPTPTSTPIQYGNITGRVYLAGNIPANNAYVVCKSYTVSQKNQDSDKSLLSLLTNITASSPLTAFDYTDPNGQFQFLSFPQGNARIEAFQNLSAYQADPNNPLAAVNLSVIAETTGLELHQGEVEPTPLPTPTTIPTATNTPGGPTEIPTATNTPGGPTNTPTNTPPAGSTPTNTPTPTATNTASPTPTNTTIPSGNPSITSVNNNGTACTGCVARDNDSITVAGSNFGSSQGTIVINGVNATINSWSPTSITCTVANGTFQNNGPIVPFSLTTSDSKNATFDKFVMNYFNSSDVQSFTNIQPSDVCFDSTGSNFYISDAQQLYIRNYNFSTRSQNYISTQLPGPIAYIDFCNTNSNVYGSSGSRIYKFPSDLSSSSTFGLGTYNAADGVSWNSVLGKILIADYNAFGSVVYNNSLDGSTISTFLDQATLDLPAGPMASDQNGNIYIGSGDTDLIKKFDSSGSPKYQFSQKYPGGITCATSGSNTILLISGLTASSQPCVTIVLCTNSNYTILGNILLTGYGIAGLDYSNHNLLVCSTNPKAILLIKL